MPPTSSNHTHGYPFIGPSLWRRAFLIPIKEEITIIKVRILDRCEFCDEEAYVYDCEDVDTRGETYDHYRPCEMCHGSSAVKSFEDLDHLVRIAKTHYPDRQDAEL